MTEAIEGTCLSMCPEKERWIREKEGLLHKFEIEPSTRGSRFPKADPSKTVKCFSRAAAGLDMTDPSQLRPASVLLSTLRYLFTEIATRTDVDWVTVYDFIFDRLRSIRQDIAIQRIDVRNSIRLFEPIVRFLLYSGQRLCERSISEYNAKINDQHLTECMARLLVLYDDDKNDYERNVISRSESDVGRLMQDLQLQSDRAQMEALFILVNMGNVDALTRALNLPAHLRRTSDVQLSTRISVAWYRRNYVRVFSLIRQLSPILKCAAMTNVQRARRVTLKIMSVAYSSKAFTFPGLKLQRTLLYNDIERVRADCQLFGLSFSPDQNVFFHKANFRDEVPLAHPEAHYTQEVMEKFVPGILLNTQQDNVGVSSRALETLDVRRR